eukprot:gnl/MRDRNA2_/MRDRNA2_17485_c0_seq1.p1 gnl/MRDRNA2_/MRDRNA2_17485_c0~~gnl/MRDRNA2_/MRDRNA2_17485_c0_seq1.p1  ORF type:complete len:763 (-),score=129.40 gnl/MRDRNA2_/MRDRNA2_17485_c0_seq1:59-2056(-)
MTAPPPTNEWRAAPPSTPSPQSLLSRASPGNVLGVPRLNTMRTSPGGILRWARRVKLRDPLPPLDHVVPKIKQASEVKSQSKAPSLSSINPPETDWAGDPHFAFKVKLEAQQKMPMRSPRAPRLNPKMVRQVKGGDLSALGVILRSCFGTLEAAFRQFDHAGNGRIVPHEWSAGLVRIGLSLQTASALFKALDVGKKLHLTVDNLVSGCMPGMQGTMKKGKQTWLHRTVTRGNLSVEIDDNASPTSHSTISPKLSKSLSRRIGTCFFRDDNSAEMESLLKDSFAEEVRDRLRKLGDQGMEEFPSSLTAHQRKVVHAVAHEAKMWSKSQGKGTERHVVVFNLMEFEEHVRQLLGQLPAGQVEAFPPTLTSVQRRLVQLVAEELGLWALPDTKDGQCRVYVGDFHEFGIEVRKELLKLPEGQKHTFPASLSTAQRQVVHVVAHSLGLCTYSEECGVAKTRSEDGRQVVVQNLLHFADEVRTELLELPDGDSKVFPAYLSIDERKMVHMVASELGLPSNSTGDGYARQVVVGVAAPNSPTFRSTQVPRAGEQHEEDDSDGCLSDFDEELSDVSEQSELDAASLNEREHIERLFTVYSNKSRMHWGEFQKFLGDHDLGLDQKRGSWVKIFGECEQLEGDISRGRGLDAPTGSGISLEFFKLCLHMGLAR